MDFFPSWLFKVWLHCLLFFVHFCRIGEAVVPGPIVQEPDSFMDPPSWTLPGTPDFVLGAFNPAGISNKFHMLDSIPHGWWHVTESQASKGQQHALRGYLRALSMRSGRNIRCSLGAPAALRPGSDHAGTWTGVLSFGDCPIQQIPCLWPSGEFESGRVLISAACVHGLEIVAATVYLPPRGPTYPNAVALSESLLAPITEELVFGRSGCRAILGDMNCSAGSLQQMELWIQNGWVEVQALMQQMHGVDQRHTCKHATSPDQIWLSPELAALVCNIALWDAFPDHKALLAGIRLPDIRLHEFQWPLPGHVPWDQVNMDKWSSVPSWGSLFGSNQPHVVRGALASVPNGQAPSSSSCPTDCFHKWSHAFERAVSGCIEHAAGRVDKSFYGRGRLTKPVQRRLNAPLLKPHRPGEVAPVSGFLNRAVAAWYKQVRRLQSFCHAAKSSRSAETYESRMALWHSVLEARGFQGSFKLWWPSRPYPHQGSPSVLPALPPDSVNAQLIHDDFLQNFRRFELWQLKRRKESTQAKLQAATKTLFTTVRKPSKPPLDFLVDSHSRNITVVDTVENIIQVPEPFPVSDTAHWTLQGLPARVKPVPTGYQVDSDFALATGQTLTCHHMICNTEVIHGRLRNLWSPRWNKHAEVPSSHWDRVCQYAAETLPESQIVLPPITSQDFRKAAKAFKPAAATGPCGWTRADINHLSDAQIDDILQGYHAIEQGQPWPKQWSVGLIHCLQKRDTSVSVEEYRPITVMSLFYRLFAGIRAGQILAQLSSFAVSMQCGFMKGREAADVWYFIGICLELAAHQAVPLHGLVADLVKAYNTLPRKPVFFCLARLGVPVWFLKAWENHLSHFERFFVVRRCTGDPLTSVTGFPEGCPLACTAMTALDFFWHWAVRTRVPRALPVSFVDNLELLCDDLPSLLAAAAEQDALCHALDLEIDRPRLYAWSSVASGRHELKSRGYNISLADRDLGGQVIYSRQLRNRMLTDRIESVLPFFGRLRKATLPVEVKKLNIKQVLWPRAMHGIEAATLGKGHLRKLRTGVMRALKWDRAGASPWVRLGLFHLDLDPAWQQLWRVISRFRQQCSRNGAIFEWWSNYCAQLQDGRTHGPFGKLQEEINNLGLQLDHEGLLWFSENGYINLRTSSDSLVKQVLRFHFVNWIAQQVQQRQGYEDLDGFDYYLTTSHDHFCTAAEVEQLMIIRDGAFFTNDAISHFDARKSAECPWCQVPDSRMHRYTTCSQYDEIRAQHSDLFSLWEELPDSFKLHGLVPKNPWRLLAWEALAALPDKTADFQFRPQGHTWHVFTDGSCDSPANPEEALASWAVVVADHGPTSAGPLVGVQQTILRAEVTAVLSALLWAAEYVGDLHIWCDNQNAVDNLRHLLLGTGRSEMFEHADLWRKIEALLKVTLATVHVHKVASHTEDEHCTDPIHDFARPVSRANEKGEFCGNFCWYQD
eukprot:s1936_g7.t1